jgi:hypothetical protein
MTLNGEAFSVRLFAIELGYSHDMKKHWHANKQVSLDCGCRMAIREISQ